MQRSPGSCVDNAALTQPPKPLSMCVEPALRIQMKMNFPPTLSLLEKKHQSLKERLEDCLTPLCSAPHPKVKGHPGVPGPLSCLGSRCPRDCSAEPQQHQGGQVRRGGQERTPLCCQGLL